MERRELITNKGYWIELIANQLWNATGSIESKAEECDQIAERMVNNYFMNIVRELSQSRQPINGEVKDWNKMTIQEHIEHLKSVFQFDSSGTAKSVYELIKVVEQSHKPVSGELPPSCKLFAKEDTYACPNINVCELCRQH